MAQGKIHSPEEIVKIYDFPEDEIIRLCEHHRMHAVQIEGQWRFYAFVLSPFNSDIKNNAIMVLKRGSLNKGREKNNPEETSPLSRPI